MNPGIDAAKTKPNALLHPQIPIRTTIRHGPNKNLDLSTTQRLIYANKTTVETATTDKGRKQHGGGNFAGTG
jgi:hypothetical protein